MRLLSFLSVPHAVCGLACVALRPPALQGGMGALASADAGQRGLLADTTGAGPSGGVPGNAARALQSVIASATVATALGFNVRNG